MGENRTAASLAEGKQREIAKKVMDIDKSV
jgi:hypothetical protein